MSESLVWLCVKNNNAFLVKRGKKNSRCGATQFSKESGNLMNVNSFKYSGLANKKTIDIDHNLTLSLKAPKKANAPSRNIASIPLKKCAKTSMKVVKSQGCNSFYRADLSSAAAGRYAKLYRDSQVKKGLVKPARAKFGRNSRA
mmetsp:Transcript_25745/g.43373  ORF Transcript_25745/g.43373 Transcript_25745/m.43373 type:complete len:144 (+) Transcript_25745:104-535(+)|eukprot:CAMPEP_0114413772 /NCGR_PEP_ID=MMETSP0103-20121206/1032_1 /TAXON_ID=37642 ORGANISM="Paraphysomonas imperforata, Strain PA2" /NCGR_SAMPLE_ID=MMETSP0103 /ASSEMBLY_ACC=CAM_ASM_000201 /LENGTH=143 /DNA_ID=CAMNT_0001581867 /DNA_START=44 /DNA_END=475 /DNA_ORIENTATION=-